MIEFVKTTLMGGLLIILPLAVIVLLLLQATAAIQKVLQPIILLLPEKVLLPKVIALLIVVGLCFLTGLILRTRIGQLIYQAGERRVLDRIPGYTLLRSLSRQIVGEGEGMTFAPALVEIEDALVPAFLVEEHEDGSYTVFVPASPTPTVGSLYILQRERVHPVNVPFANAIKCVSKWGVGSGELLKALHRENSKGLVRGDENPSPKKR
jgi:uncharacterized membrane protein